MSTFPDEKVTIRSVYKEVRGLIQKFFSGGIWKLENLLWIVLGLITVYWLYAFGYFWKQQALPLAGLTFASFMVGCLAAFLFTSTSDEAASLGKIRDWLIGAVTGLTIVKFDSIKDFLKLFVDAGNPFGFSLVVSTAITYSAIGFFFMFFKRELVYNILLAAGRAERGRIEGTNRAGVVTLELFAILPASIFAGVEDADTLLKSRPQEAKKVTDSLCSDEVKKFLSQSETALKAGTPLDWDIVSKVAYLHYYRSYFVKDDDKPDQRAVAYEWITRALVINPAHMDLALKRADVLALMERYSEVVATLERLYQAPECPVFVEQWLGYYLLFLNHREKEAIHYSARYRERYPNSSETACNIACAYGQIVCRNSQLAATLDTTTDEYKLAIKSLKQALAENPGDLKRMQTDWIAPTGSFACFAKDKGFRDAVHLPDFS